MAKASTENDSVTTKSRRGVPVRFASRWRWWWVASRGSPTTGSWCAPSRPAEPGGPAFMGDLGGKNYLIGFGALLLGLAISAHPSTPMGRGRGVVVGMLGCFLVGLLWICTFYPSPTPRPRSRCFDDLDQWNLVVGIAFMAVGFTFATRWE